MINPPFVSIIVVNWNGEKYIENCINSLLRMNYQNFEIIIIDNNSSDDSIKILNKLKRNTKIKVIFNTQNLGFSRACNIGILHTKSELVALFNNDAIASSDWLEKLVKNFQESNQIGAAAGLIYYKNPPNKIWFAGGKIDSITGFLWHNTKKEITTVDETKFDTLTGCAILINRNTLEKIGLLDEGFFIYGEDVDLSLNIKRMGQKIVFVNDAITWHNVSASKKKAKDFIYITKQFSEIQLILKHFSIKQITTALFFRCILLPITESIYFTKQPTAIKNNMIVAFKILMELKRILLKRKQTKSLGELRLKNRFKEAITEAKGRISDKKLNW